MNTAENIDEYSCTIEMHFHDRDVDAAIKLLHSVIGCIKAKAGCIDCLISMDTVASDRIRYCETWESESYFHTHTRSGEFKCILVAMDMCCEEPGVRIGSFSGEAGLQFLRRLDDESIAARTKP